MDTGDYVSVGSYPFQLRLATSGDLNGIFRLLDGAAAWLRATKDTDQWERPWPTREARDARVRVGVENGETWIVLDGYVPMGTVTIARKHNIDVWSNLDPGCRLSDRAVYVHRLITARNYAGWRVSGRNCSTGLAAKVSGYTAPSGSGSTCGRPTWDCITTT